MSVCLLIFASSTSGMGSDVATMQRHSIGAQHDEPVLRRGRTLYWESDGHATPCPTAFDDMTDGGVATIVDIAAGNDDFTTLVAALMAAGLVDAISGDGPFTVFAPTNEAFAALPEGTVESLLLPENIEQLQDILKYHVVAGSFLSSDLMSGDVETLNGDFVTITVSEVGIMVNDATVVSADIVASNGVIHVIDKVLLPPTDEVEEPVDATPTSMPISAMSTIVDIAAGNDDFTTLVAALMAAGLVDVISGDGPFTVFAPKNEAFAALPEGTVESLLLPENIEQLQDILKYHVVAGSFLSSDLMSGDVETLNGDFVTITVSEVGIMVNDATVVSADIVASNGVIHVIDKVLLPPSDDMTEEVALSATAISFDSTTSEASVANSGSSISLLFVNAMASVTAMFYLVALYDV